jgi:hypothetical protein
MPFKHKAYTPPLGLLCKLGSIIVHAEEMMQPDGHDFDRVAMETLLADRDVRKWIDDMGSLLPLKRSARR